MSKTFLEEFANYCRARFPYIYISTWEEERVIHDIQQVADAVELIKTPRNVFTWSVTNGLTSRSRSETQETKNPIKALEFIEKYQEPSIFIMKDFHVYFGGNNRQPDQTIIRKVRDLLTYVEKSPSPKNVIFVSPSLVIPYELQKDISILDYGLPSFEEIREVLNKMIRANQSNTRITIHLTLEEQERLAKAALGLTLQEAENAFALALVSEGRLDIDSVESVLKEKQQIIKKTGILEYIKSEPNMEDVGGLENIKRWLKKRDKSWLDSAEEYGLPSPKGVLLTGVPGCGKSLIAKSISSMWHLPLLKLDMGRIFSGIVGSSEENMRKAIETAEAISPSILWIDEMEKGLTGVHSSGDSGTASRILSTILTWMQEKTKPVFVVATANQIQYIPPELLRKGRFDEIFFVDLPTKRERKEIFHIHLSKRLKSPKALGDFTFNDGVLEKLADLTETFIGAEIEQVVISALFEAFSQNRGLEYRDLEKVIETTVPLSVTQSEQIRAIREWADIRAVAATPKEYREEYKDNKTSNTTDFHVPKDEDIRSKRGGRTVDF
ncbi:AAA family ATPase [Bacillus sp. CHD6a]|uniref:AAA family ATPase n=1 Tax=Bacillus sp. CHD6a TaxID=1643452 RepID=UPI0006CC33F3|nr:AAA family ATPase [Bacillus sp. CHD6a]KPB03424.1 ATPase [Bacillus sp. CHD6a]